MSTFEYYGRSKSSPDVVKTWVQQYYVNGNLSQTWNRSYTYTPSVMTGVGIVGFHRLKKAGALLPHTEFYQAKSTAELNLTDYYQRLNNGQTVEHRQYSLLAYHGNATIGHASAADTSRINALVQAAAAEISNAGWDAGTFVSEIPSLHRMFSKTAKRMVRLAKSRKGFSKSAKDLHKAWLEGRYGWRTLAYDIRDLNDAITEWDSKRSIWTERKGYSYTDVETTTWTHVWSATDLTGIRTTTTEHSVRGAVAASIRPARFIVDPMQTGWELTPYSFVWDWVISVGNALAAAKLLAYSSGTTSSMGVHSVSTTEATLKAGPPKGSYVEVRYDETFRSTFETTQRTPTAISVRPQLTGRAPDPSMILDLQYLQRARDKHR